VQKRGIVTIGAWTAIFCGLLGAAQNSQVTQKDQTPTTVIATEVPGYTAAPVSEELPDDGIPHEDDVAASIDEFQNVIDKADNLTHGLKSGNPNSTEENSCWQREYELWVTKNSHLIERCQLWLGQDGTETYSSLSLICSAAVNGCKRQWRLLLLAITLKVEFIWPVQVRQSKKLALCFGAK
jgi:hypothetical protein